ncbi:MAG: ribosome-associated heat shock protein Hsp15 [Sphingomonadales bacterium]|nr:ribosome-associated heat shock protein Hsp15 [Sphingomonadales bacterium]
MADALRLDKFLWFARIVKTRALAQALAEQGRIRIAGRVVDRAHAPVRIGDVLSFAQRGAVRVLRIEALPARRGPPAEARTLYTDLSDAAAEPLTSEGGGD